MSFYITPGQADLVLSPASRGDIEGAALAILLNILIVIMFSMMVISFVNKSKQIFNHIKKHSVRKSKQLNVTSKQV
ncbi:MAG TPA: hypothetical protein PLP75_01200 [Burkholderiales bacterium]|nr:hypothetical protein [Burkholderiales bacterium]